MYPFFETLRAQGESVDHFAYHRRRMERTLRANGMPEPRTDWFAQLELALRAQALASPQPLRLHVDYDGISWQIAAGPLPTTPMRTLRLVVDNSIAYPYKSTDRSCLDRLFQQREEADDVLIVKDGYITDTSRANLLLLRQGEWFTPQHSLLPGTTQERLVEELHLQFVPIAPRELDRYEQLWIINALRRGRITQVD